MYRDVNDSEVLYMINESDDYVEIMLEKYKPILAKICKKYLKVGKSVGLEFDDLMQIANISLINSIKYYKENMRTSFYTYITRCCENNLRSEIRKELTYKKKTLNSSMSLDEKIPGKDITLLDVIKDEQIVDPSDYLIIEEKEIEYIKFVNSLPFEVAVVFEMKNNGFTTSEISKFLDIDKTEVNKMAQYAKNRLCLN